MNVGN